ncbi:adenyl-nucleotide exchange factor sse1 [Podospora pseudocomata]|uniref:Heat shock protein Hsp88 n=5 Tax=Podospora TaxID=5144 RepID=A0ABY6S617_PODCO|nr:adenyl-nucleotide exchange factor sse1 [Podospora bellae-mahoneyi]KAK4655673.1 adenyl-nucleotide exchange factor sse1 [Podospora pseudocomata]KAK4666915.1 adenyl-nucleotide exchange factor sse1 [Podospora pseudopauciseta]KAK4678090.1 adenyl-nucleotide exchange factor sse1 [Podospora pseudoanserina]VBB77069.1 Putative Heat shock protein Hsp88 [Podospora comata]
MSVVGVDFGTLNTVVAVARNRGVDVITNEVSNRATPSLVGFGPKSRYLGEPAKTQEISNLKNTVGSLKRLLGRTLNDPDVQTEQAFISAPLVEIDGQVGAEVSYLGEKTKFSATQLTAMFLGKIKQTAAAELKLPVSDLVLSVPAWFTDIQRRALIDAAEIAGLRPLRLINDTTAAALGYGITKLDLPGPDEKPRRVAFVDVGYSSYTCSIVEFKKGELSVKGTAFDRHFGGRNFDKAIVDHLAKEFHGKYKIDINSNPKALCRVYAAAEKLKKVLSANQQAPLNIESLMNDVDVRAMITRQEFEAMVEPLLNKVHVVLEQALADSRLTKEDIDIVEVVGGGSRVPSIKERVQNFFNKNLSFTLNQDEAIARGCAFSCAILSPVFKVRDFAVQDIISYPIEFAWEKDADIPDEDTSLTVFNKGNVLPSTKILTFYRKQAFDLEARYAQPEGLPGKVPPFIGRFSVKGVKATGGPEDFMICKLKARVNIHGVLNVESGYYVEDQEVEEEIKEEGDKKEGDAMDTDEKPKTRKVKKQVRKGDLPIVSATLSLDQGAKAQLFEKESAMAMEDKLVADTEEKKNELETYIYDLRNKLDDQYSEFASDEEKEKIKAKLEATEDWLYDEGDDTTKAVYVAKIDEIRALAGPIVQRHFEKVEADRQALQARLDAERAAKKAEEEARKAAESKSDSKDEEMTDADAPKAEVEEAGDP